MQAFECFSIKKISSILDFSYRYSNVNNARPFFENIPLGVVILFVAVKTIAFVSDQG